VTQFALPQHTLHGGCHRVKREVVIGRQREVVGDLDAEAEIVGRQVGWRKETRLPLHGWIGVLEYGTRRSHPEISNCAS